MFLQNDMPNPPPPAPQSNADTTALAKPAIYFTMTLDRRTNGYDQDLCVLAENSLIWI